MREIYIWLDKQVHSLPARTTPILVGDWNVALADDGEPGGGAALIGTWQRCRPNEATAMFVDFLVRHDFVCVDSHFQRTGAAFFGGDGRISVPDHMVMPLGALELVEDARVWWRSARRLQLIAYRAFRDHMPVVVWLRAAIATVVGETQRAH